MPKKNITKSKGRKSVKELIDDYNQPVEGNDLSGIMETQTPEYAKLGVSMFIDELFSRLIKRTDYSFIDSYLTGSILQNSSSDMQGYQLSYIFKEMLYKGVKLEHIQELIRCIQMLDYEHFLLTLTGEFSDDAPSWEFAIPDRSTEDKRTVIKSDLYCHLPYYDYNVDDIDKELLHKWGSRVK
jgi:hypothetical protein